MKLPDRLVGVAIGPDGRPVGLALPSLEERGAAAAWKAALGTGPYCMRFLDRAGEPDLDQVQRLARLGEVWLDCALDGVDGALDLLVAGAARLVVWGQDTELLEAIGDSAVVGWHGARAWAEAAADAARLDVPLLAYAPIPAPEPAPAPMPEPRGGSRTRVDDPSNDLPSHDLHAYQAPTPPWAGAVAIVHAGGMAGDSEDE